METNAGAGGEVCPQSQGGPAAGDHFWRVMSPAQIPRPLWRVRERAQKLRGWLTTQLGDTVQCPGA